MSTYEEILDIVGRGKRTSLCEFELYGEICKLNSPRLAYYMLYYYQKRYEHTLSFGTICRLIDVLENEDESELTEASYACLALINVRHLDWGHRYGLFKHVLFQDMKLESKYLPGALTALMHAMSGRAVVKEHGVLGDKIHPFKEVVLDLLEQKGGDMQESLTNLLNTYW